MKSKIALTHEFVEFIPEELKDRTLYVSMAYATAVHKCCCGCGREVVTPISPTGWQLTFDGKSISLYPSIGNWSLPCQSHYFITRNTLVWAPQWTKKQIARGRAAEVKAKERHYANSQIPAMDGEAPSPNSAAGKLRKNLWQKITRLFS